MRVAVVHGYFLGDSGSAIYTRELARELVRQGHEVTLVCQEQRADDYHFIDRLYTLDDTNSKLFLSYEREEPQPLAGSCRLVRPNLEGELLTYVPGAFPGFQATAFQEAGTAQIERYVAANIAALTTAFARWPQDLVQANHTVMQPHVVRRSLNGSAPYLITVHGSELNFTIKKDQRIHAYALSGLEGAAAVCALSEASRHEIAEFAAGQGLDITEKTSVLFPGVNTDCFRLVEQRAEVLKKVSGAIGPERDDILVFAGRLMWTKGLHYAVAALPLILQKRPDLQLLIAGEGPMHAPLERLIEALDSGSYSEAQRLLATEPELAAEPQYGPVLPEMYAEEQCDYVEAARGNLRRRIHFLGHLDHAHLAEVYGAADLSLAPSVFPEAFALVSVEALAAGAIPVVTDQSGLRSFLGVLVEQLEDQSLRQLKPGVDLTRALAGTAVHLLRTYPTRDSSFRQRLRSVVESRFSWKMVADRYLELGHSEVRGSSA